VIKKLAHYDALTGATNRYLFTDRFKQAVARVKRVGESLSFMCFDLDKFKTINDEYGHDVGDDYLRMFVSFVNDCTRDTDTFGRLGGDEFGLLLPKAKEEDAVALAKRIIKTLTKARNIQNHRMSIKTSIGIVVAQENEDTDKLNYKNLTAYADKAVFISKNKVIINLAYIKTLSLHSLLPSIFGNTEYMTV
jgi:diguanylate cyclase (GGDEF)-like protein